MSNQDHIIAIPRHPDDAHIPDSIMNIVLPSGRTVQIVAPLNSKTMATMGETLKICRDSIVQKPDDFQI